MTTIPIAAHLNARLFRHGQWLSAAWLLIAIALAPQPVHACFGPKLYIGTGSSSLDLVFYEVVSLYLREKTGVESMRVELQGDDPLTVLDREEADLVRILAPRDSSFVTLLAVDGYLHLLSGARPLEDLQFTTVAPALRKLDALLRPEHLEALRTRVKQGRPPAAEARRFLMSQGWI